MTGIQPVLRSLTEEQFANMINGTKLSDAEMQALRRSYGLALKQDSNFVGIDFDGLATAAWRKTKKLCQALGSVPPL